MESCAGRRVGPRALVAIGRPLAWTLGLACFPAYAHGFGERYLLPVPFWLYAAGAGATVALSFIVLALLAKRPGIAAFPRLNLLRLPGFRALSAPALLAVLRICSVLVFLVVVVAGLAGDQDPASNLAPTFVWVVWWVGLAFVCALLGNLWILVNPWKILFTWAEHAYRLLGARRPLAFGYSYPAWLGAWPAVLGFLVFAWIEIVFIGAARPRFLALLALAYSVLTLTGMVAFGKHVWLRNCESFSVFFGLLARTAITEVRVTSATICDRCSCQCAARSEGCLNCDECIESSSPSEREWNLRPPGAGLVRPAPLSVSHAAFVLMMLATVSFDGLLETGPWMHVAIPLYSLVGNAQVAGGIALVAFSLLFAGTYLVASRLAVAVSGTAARQRPDTLVALVYSLVPIAVAYHFAHYASYVFAQGQFVIPLVSDPLGLGWDLFGTRDFSPGTFFTDPRVVWLSAVIAIVLGHLLAVFVSHVLAMRVFPDPGSAMRSQSVMVVLMVSYTMLSLWIVSQPLTLDAAAAPR